METCGYETVTTLLLATFFGLQEVFADSQGKFPGIGSKADYDRSSVYHNQAYSLAAKGDHLSAIKLYRQAISIYPHNSGSYQDLGNELRKTGQLEESITAQKKAIELEPGYLSAWLGLGMCYERMGKLAEAEKCYRKSVEINPNSYGAVFDLGDILRQQGRIAEARSWLLRARSCPECSPKEVDNAINLCNRQSLPKTKEASN